MKKKLLAMLLAGCMVLSMTACGSKETEEPAETTEETAGAAEETPSAADREVSPQEESEVTAE